MSTQTPQIEEDSSKFNFFTSIWLVPFIALLISAWLAYQYFSQRGPLIRISFPTNEGLKAGQSQVKYRNIPVGLVEKVMFDEEGEGVVVMVRMDKNMIDYLNKDAKFWIVKPEVGFRGISGLDTLISGTYINIDAQKREKFTALVKRYQGLNYRHRNNEDGKYFVLNASSGYTISEGTPLYFKNIRAGTVEYVYLSLDNKSVDFVLYVKKEFVPYVHPNSKFWVMSALAVDISNGRLDVNIAPLPNIIHGGIAFSSKGGAYNDAISDAYVFHLYKNGSIADGKKVGKGGESLRHFKLFVRDSIAKLKLDASVRYDGFDVGHVSDIKTSYDRKTHEMRAKVVIEIDTSFFEDNNEINSTGDDNFYRAVEEGLRARITPTDPLTGMLFVDLVFEANVSFARIKSLGGEEILPTMSYKNQDIMGKVQSILDKINNLKLEKLLLSLNTVVDTTGTIITGIDKPLDDILVDFKIILEEIKKMTQKKSFAVMPDELDKMLKALKETLRVSKKVIQGYGNNSLISKQLSTTLKVVTRTSEEMRYFLKMLNRKPNSLIFGDK